MIDFNKPQTIRITCAPSLVDYLRREVEALVKKKHGGTYLKDRQAKTELAGIKRELKRLKTQIAALKDRKAKLLANIES